MNVRQLRSRIRDLPEDYEVVLLYEEFARGAAHQRRRNIVSMVPVADSAILYLSPMENPPVHPQQEPSPTDERAPQPIPRSGYRAYREEMERQSREREERERAARQRDELVYNEVEFPPDDPNDFLGDDDIDEVDEVQGESLTPTTTTSTSSEPPAWATNASGMVYFNIHENNSVRAAPTHEPFYRSARTFQIPDSMFGGIITSGMVNSVDWLPASPAPSVTGSGTPAPSGALTPAEPAPTPPTPEQVRAAVESIRQITARMDLNGNILEVREEDPNAS